MKRKRIKAQRVFSKMRLPKVLKTKKRQKEVKLRKNFLPTLIIIFILWASLAYLIFFVDPEQSGAVAVFFIILFLALLFTLSTLLANTRRGFIISISSTFFLILTYLEVGNIVNLILIITIALITEIYFIKA